MFTNFRKPLFNILKLFVAAALIFLHSPVSTVASRNYAPDFQGEDPQDETTSVESPVWELYTDPHWGISFAYLSNWSVTENFILEDDTREIELFNLEEGRIYITRFENPDSLLPSEWFEQSRIHYNNYIQVIGELELLGTHVIFIGLPNTCKSAPLVEAIIGKGDKIFKFTYFATKSKVFLSEFQRLLESLSIDGEQTIYESIPESYVTIPPAPKGYECPISNFNGILDGTDLDLQSAAPTAQICRGADFYIPSQGTLFSPYRCFNNKFCSLYKTGGSNEFGYPHSGLDIMGSENPGIIPIYATGTGTASVTGSSAVRIIFTNPTWSSYSAYNAHMATGIVGQPSYRDFRKVKTGDPVIAGETIIGYMGNFDNSNTGNTNVHLHISYNDAQTDYMSLNETEDPTIFLKAKYLKFTPEWDNRGPIACSDSTGSGAVDVFFLVDLSGSFSDDLVTFKQQAPGIIASLKAKNPDTRFGIGKFEDYPIYPFGTSSWGDKAYQRLVDLTTDSTRVINAINSLYTRDGYDVPESQLAALFQVATGVGQDLSSLGYPGASIPAGQQATFRRDASKLILLWTDAPFHNPGDSGDIPYPGPSKSEVASAILAAGITQCGPLPCGPALLTSSGSFIASASQNENGLRAMVIGISSGSGALPDLQDIARLTGADAPEEGVDCNSDGVIDVKAGEPLVCGISYNGVGIGEAIESLVEAATTIEYNAFLPVIKSRR